MSLRIILRNPTFCSNILLSIYYHKSIKLLSVRDFAPTVSELKIFLLFFRYSDLETRPTNITTKLPYLLTKDLKSWEQPVFSNAD